MTSFRGPRPTEAPWFERETSPLAKKLFTLDDAPKGLEDQEKVLWVDAANAIWVLSGATKGQAIASANAFLESADLDVDPLEAWDDQN